jgi:hypothetical protein
MYTRMGSYCGAREKDREHFDRRLEAMDANPTNEDLAPWPSSPFTRDKDLPTASNAQD